MAEHACKEGRLEEEQLMMRGGGGGMLSRYDDDDDESLDYGGLSPLHLISSNNTTSGGGGGGGQNVMGINPTTQTSDDDSNLLERLGPSPPPPDDDDDDLVRQIVEDVDGSEQSRKPLGLILKKTPSLIHLAEAIMSRDNSSSTTSSSSRNLDESSSRHQAAPRRTSANLPSHHKPMPEKKKASNFPASFLRIGNWQRISRHEGDLIAKFYYAKRKLVWEILEGALKSKIELQWSDIVALRAVIKENQPSVLEIEVHQPPLFYKETNPQPRKHTLWQQASDFTRGQASIWRRHYVRFPPGILDRHYAKLLQYDQRLQLLSLRPFPTHHSPYFEQDHHAYVYGSSHFTVNGYGSLQNQHLQSFEMEHASTLDPHHLSTMPVMNIPRMSDQASSSNAIHQPHRGLWGQELNSGSANAGEDYVHVLPPITCAHSDLLYPNQDCVFNWVQETEGPISDRGVLNDIEIHLLSESDIASSDEPFLLSDVHSMLEPIRDANNINNSMSIRSSMSMRTDHVGMQGHEMMQMPYLPAESISWLPPDQSSSGNFMLQAPPHSSNSLPLEYSLSNLPGSEFPCEWQHH